MDNQATVHISYKLGKINFIKVKGEDSCVSTEKPLHSMSLATSLLLYFLEFVLLFCKKNQWATTGHSRKAG